MRGPQIFPDNGDAMSILILARPDDAHALKVSEWLTEYGAEWFILGPEELSNDTEITFRFDETEPHYQMKLPDNRVIDLNEVESIWYRRTPNIQHQGLPKQWMNSMVESELRSAYFGAFRSLTCLHVNHPSRNEASSYKLFQLELARKVGLTIPQTLVTNRPDQVAEFYKKCNSQVIYKLIGERTNFYLPKYEPAPGVPTLPLRDEDLAHLDQVSLAPHIFQECIRKKYDIRVTVIGKKLFAVKIDSQAGEGSLDWRRDYSVAMDPIDLPDEVHSACFNLVERLGLNYGAIDLCVDQAGRHVFFEINNAGQYLWMEQKIESMQLSMEMAKLLVGKSEPMAGRNQAGEKSAAG